MGKSQINLDTISSGFNLIPAGAFIMDRHPGLSKETSERKITLPSYWISRRPITVGQFRTFLEATERPKREALNLSAPNESPIEAVNWYEATTYCEWLSTYIESRMKGFSVRLPSKFQWEKAAQPGNPYGCEDMGKVYEWTRSVPNKDSCPDPHNAREYRVLGGMGFYAAPKQCDTICRGDLPPGNRCIGFRFRPVITYSWLPNYTPSLESRS